VAWVSDLLALQLIAPDGTALLTDGTVVRALAVGTLNAETLGGPQVRRVAHGLQAVVNTLSAGQELLAYVEARPIHVDTLLSRQRAHHDAAAAAIARSVTGGDVRAQALRRLARAHEDTVARHASRDAARDVSCYLIVPYRPPRTARRASTSAVDRGDAARRHVEQIRDRLHGLGLPAEPLDGAGYFALLWRRLNPGAAARGDQPPTPVFTEMDYADESGSVALRGALCQTPIGAQDARFLTRGEDLEQTIYAGSLPEVTTLGWLRDAMRVTRPFVLCVHLRALDRLAERRKLRARYRRIHGINRGRLDENKHVDPDSRRQEEELDTAVDELGAQHRAQPFEVSIYQSILQPAAADAAEQLADIVDRAAGELAVAGDLAVHRGALRQVPLWRSTLPLGPNPARRGQLYFSRHAADTLPFAAAGCSSPTGLPFAFAVPGGGVQLLNFWDRAHDNNALTINGKSGRGKTMATISLVSQLIAQGAHGAVIDRAGHYRFLCDLVPGARHLTVGHSRSAHTLNPWDRSADRAIPEQIAFLVDLHALLLGALDTHRAGSGLSDRERMVLEDASAEVYHRANNEKRDPLERDLHAVLVDRVAGDPGSSYAELAQDLAWRVRRFCDDGPYAHLLDRPTTVAMDAPLTVFDTQGVSDALAPGVMFLIGEHVTAGIARRRAARTAATLSPDTIFGHSFLVLEEAWSLVSNPVTGPWVSDKAKRSRHTGLALIAVTQQLDDLTQSDHGRALLRQSSQRLFFFQDGEDLDILEQTAGLSARETQLISELQSVRGRYSQAYWLNGTRGRSVVELRPSPAVYWLATSEPVVDVPRREQAIRDHAGDSWAALDALAAETA
jgi:hypothetical protein